VQEPLQNCFESRSKSKKCDKQLTHIVRVRFRAYLICPLIQFLILSTSPKSMLDDMAGSFAAFGIGLAKCELQMCLTDELYIRI